MTPEHPENYPRRILVAVTGLSPQVVTETLYALTQQTTPAYVPTEIHLITTRLGAEHARLNLLSDAIGWFHRLCKDLSLPAIGFTPDHIHVIPDASHLPLEDIRDRDDNTRAANFICARVAEFTADPEASLHVSLAGGRKTMSYYLGYALSLFGRAQDRLSHVLVSAPYENHRDFYYPTPYEHPLHVRENGKEIAYDCRKARVDLADIPFVRLRAGLPEELLRGEVEFSQAVAAAQCLGRRMELVIDTLNRSATASGEPLRLSPQSFTLLLWLARRRKEGRGPVHCSSKEKNREAADEYLTLCRAFFGMAPKDSEVIKIAEKALQGGMDGTWFSPAKSRLNGMLSRALGENGARPYQVLPVAGRRDAMFELAIAPRLIRIL